MGRKNKLSRLELMTFEIFLLLLAVEGRNIFDPVFVYILRNRTLLE